MSVTVKCTCISTASGWDETKCAYHGKPAKPFVRFRMVLGSNKYICPQRNSFGFLRMPWFMAQVAEERA